MSHVDEGTLHAYLDGELTPVERMRLEEHLAGCASCRGRLAEERALIAQAQELLGRAVPAQEPVTRRGSGGAGAPARALPRWVPLAWAASVLLALGGGWWAAQPRGSTEESLTSALRQERDAPASALADRDTAPAAANEPAPAAPRPRRHAPEAVAPTAVDAAAPAAGKVSAEVTPPALQESLAGAAAPAAPAVVGGRAVVMAWGPVSRDSARALLGTSPLAVADVPVARIRAAPAGDGTVLVEQPLSATVTIRLYQRRPARDEAAAGRGGRADAARIEARIAPPEALARYVDGVRVEILGALPADSLNRLLDRLRPIP